MRKTLAAACFALFASSSYAQTPVLNPVTPITGTAGPNGSAQPVSPSNPLPVTGSGSGGSTPVTIQPSNSPSVGLPATAPSSALSSSWTGCSATCNLYDFQVNTTTAAVWVLAFDATALPSNGAVTPKKWWQVTANSTLGASWDGGPPLNLTTGLVLGCSTTGPFVLTASTTCVFSGEVKQ